MTTRNGPSGAGSQLVSLSAPGDLFWKYSVNPPSASFLNCGIIGELSKYRLSGLSTINCAGKSYMVIDQNALTGGNWSGVKRMVYRLPPSSFCPSASTAYDGYIASCCEFP